jgi:phosphate starvation-inducible membrane PsiE
MSILCRAISNLDSEYFFVKELLLDYLLSLLEGHQSSIIEYFSATFDIPVIYEILVQIVTGLRAKIKDQEKEKENSHKNYGETNVI